MARQTVNITTSAITWEPLESGIEISEKGEATITASGFVNSRGTSMMQAQALIPTTLPIASTGPVGNSTELNGAKLVTQSVRGEDGMWKVSASYKKSFAATADYDGTERSGNDRAERRIITSLEPILSHPVALKFSTKDRSLLNGMLNGTVIPNPNYVDEESGVSEFIGADPETGAFDVAVDFSTDNFTEDDVTANALDYARNIKAGIESYARKSIRHVWSVSRNRPASDADYRKVGRIVTSPPLAPDLPSGYQWMLVGIIDRTENGDTWNTDYEYDASGAGGYLSTLYGGGLLAILG
jgi:hypothetical protein